MSGELPPGWRRVALADASFSCLGKMLDRQKHTDGKALPYLRNQNVRWFSVDDTDVLDMFFEDRELERYGLRRGDVLICEGGEPGRAAIWDGRRSNMKFQKALHRVRPDASLLPEWLVYRLWHDAQSGALQSYFTGTTIKHFTGTSLARYELPLPPINEQRRIVAKLDALQARSRRAREALDAVPPLLEKLRQSILAAAFRGDLTKDWRAKNKDVEPASTLLERIRAERRKKWEESELANLKAKGKPPINDKWKSKYTQPAPVDPTGLPELPAGWCWASPDEVAAPVPNALTIGPFGSDLKVSDYRDDGVPLVFVRDIRAERFGDEKTKFVTEEKAEALVRHMARSGDLLMTKMGDPPGDTAVYPAGRAPAVITADCIKLTPFLPLTDGEFLKYCFRAHDVRSQLLEQTAGVAQQKLSLERFRTVRVPLPSREEQRELVARLDALFRSQDSVFGHVDCQLGQLRKLDAAVLAKAFRGELVQQTPNDEPAEAVLARKRGSIDPEAGVVSRRGARPRSPLATEAE